MERETKRRLACERWQGHEAELRNKLGAWVHRWVKHVLTVGVKVRIAILPGVGVPPSAEWKAGRAHGML